MYFSKFIDIISSLSDGSIIKFKNRETAGKSLSYLLKKRVKNNQNDSKFIVVCIPRGGVIVGDVIARNFGLILNIILPKRLLSPGNEELTIGSVMKDGTYHLDNFMVNSLKISNDYLQKEKNLKIKEIELIETLYGKQIEGNKLKSKNIILVDDGAATGSTLIVASKWIKTFYPNHLTIATPICPKDILKFLKSEVNTVVSLINPLSRNFTTVSKFYQDFLPISDEQVIDVLKKYKLSECS
ncbi:MAG TPA: phosphoribosyltransferase family protein [Nitrososphaeraceae archaeon]|nr:phosphoribosyltransferase family protein [Nitrososphaeraceae archaeon]